MPFLKQFNHYHKYFRLLHRCKNVSPKMNFFAKFAHHLVCDYIFQSFKFKNMEAKEQVLQAMREIGEPDPDIFTLSMSGKLLELGGDKL